MYVPTGTILTFPVCSGISESTKAQRRAIAPPVRRDRALTSRGRKPRVGPKAVAEVRSASVMCWAVTYFQDW